MPPTDEDIHYHLMTRLAKTNEHSEIFLAAEQIRSYTLYANALTHTLVVVLPTFTTAATAVISVENSDGNEIYATSSLTEGGTHVVAIEKPFIGKHKIIITLNAASGGTHTVKITWYLQGKG